MVVLAALSVACEVASAPEIPAPIATAGPETCAPAEAVDFTWALGPVAGDIARGVACVLGEVTADGGALVVPLECAEPEGARARTLAIQAAPPPPTAALRAGMAVRLWAIAAVDEDGAVDRFVRLETASGGLLIAAAQAGALRPPDGSDPWLPFVITAAASACMSEETACGSQERSAIDLRRAGGPPRVLHDQGFAAVGDRGEAQLWVTAAIVGDTACLGASGASYGLGLIAAR
ncbi:MAG TPA: hypothetical protein VGB85_33205 [Nannocystis sp.]